MSDYDVCMCGDYRHQHKDGTGKCNMPDDLTHGFQTCREFRLAGVSTDELTPAPECKPQGIRS